MAKVPPYVPPIRLGSGTGNKMWVQQGTSSYTLAKIQLDSSKLVPSSVWRISGLIRFYTPSVAGKAVYILLGSSTVQQCFPVTATQHFGFELYVYVDSSGSAIVRAQPYLGSGSGATSDGTGSFFGANTNPPTYTTGISISGNPTLTIKSRVAGTPSSSGEFHELIGFTFECISDGNSPANYSETNALACWGDSLTAGAGATAGSQDYPHVLATLTPGRPFYNGGVGGETAAQIVTRQKADVVRGKYWTQVLWIGRNNVGSGTMQADVLSALSSAVANLSHSRYIIMTVLNMSTEPNGHGNKTALDALNSAIIAAYPAANVLDIRTTVCTEANGTPNPAWLSDTIHLNATGYAAVAAAVNAKLTANGW